MPTRIRDSNAQPKNTPPTISAACTAATRIDTRAARASARRIRRDATTYHAPGATRTSVVAIASTRPIHSTPDAPVKRRTISIGKTPSPMKSPPSSRHASAACFRSG